MKKERKAFYEEKNFNSVEEATSVELKCENLLRKNKIGIIIGAITIVWDMVLVILMGSTTILNDIEWRITTTAFCIIPFFPIDLMVAYVAFMLALAAV